MDRLFLDANVLFSAAYKPDARVLRLWNLEDVVLCSSRYAVEEARINLHDEVQQRKLAELVRSFRFFEAPERSLPKGISLPAKDAPILLAAIEARADYLLTGDFQHFGAYFGKKAEGIVIVSPAQYLKQRDDR
jgi:predicted nucleic acid-binding protein